MPEPQPQDGGAPEVGGEETQVDAFGDPIGADDNEVAEEELGDDKNEDKGGKKDNKGKSDITEDHPTIVALKEDHEKRNKELGENLSKQGKIIEDLQRQLKEAKGEEGGDKKVDVKPLFETVKASKDLTDQEKEEMTETEIKQFDEIATLKNALNTINESLQKRNQEETGKHEEQKQESVNKVVQSTAKELAKESSGKDDTKLANEIIENFKGMKFDLEGLSEDDIKNRVAIAATQVSDYKPPKEQTNKKGGTVKSGSNNDPFAANDAIVNKIGKGNDGNYSL